MGRYYVKNGVLATAGVALAITVSWCISILSTRVVINSLSISGFEFDRQLSVYERTLWVTLLTTVVLAVAWHVIALFDVGRRGDRRAIWFILWMLAPLQGVLWLYVFLNESLTLAIYLITALNEILTFWLATVWCTPSAHKYTPLGSIWLRRLGVRR